MAILVVNHYLNTEKYNDMTLLLTSSAEKYGIELTVKTNAELLESITIGGKISLPESKRPKEDFVLFWDKDVTLCKMLEAMGKRVYNSSSAIAACDNKGLTHAILSSCNIPMPRTIAAPLAFFRSDLSEFVASAAEKLGFPLIIKESYGSFGSQVYKADNLEDAIDIANSVSPKQMIFQEFVKESEGRDIRINVVGGKAVASMERFSPDDFRANVTLGGKMRQYTPTREEEKIAVSAAEKLGLDFGGVDILFGKDSPLLCEVNSNAHIRNILDCTGINVADKIFEHILKA
jgi:RimK family alpha-L-glutamate ligase